MKNTLAENMLRFGTKNLSESVKQQLNEQAVPLPTGAVKLTMVKPPEATRFVNPTDLGFRVCRYGSAITLNSTKGQFRIENPSTTLDSRVVSFIYVGTPTADPNGIPLSLYGQKNPVDKSDIPNKLLSTAYFKPEISDSTNQTVNVQASYKTSPLPQGKYLIVAVVGGKRNYLSFTVS